MKRTCIAAVLAVFAFVSVPTHCHADHWHSGCLDNVDIDIEDGSLIITPDDSDDCGKVEITENYELYVNGRRVKLDGAQERLVEDYYDQFMYIIDCAKEIGCEGAKIGAQGVKIGLQAVAGIFRLLCPDYDCNDLELDVTREARRIEAKAKKLERRARKIEDMVDDFESLHRKLKNTIPELAELEWF